MEQPKRFGMVIGIKPQKIDEYKKLHANCWPEILESMEQANMRNFSIYLAQIEKGKFYLFGYYEYHGEDFEADMAKMSECELSDKWRELCEACQQPVPIAQQQGQWWLDMEEVFHAD